MSNSFYTNICCAWGACTDVGQFPEQEPVLHGGAQPATIYICIARDFELLHTWDGGKKTQAHAAMPCHVVCLPAACGVSAWRAPGHTRQVGDVARPHP